VSTDGLAELTDRQFDLIGRALAEPRRVQFLRQISEAHAPVACRALIEAHTISPATVSHHVKELERAGLIRCIREGREMSVAIERGPLDAYIARLQAL
jgi:DNA-binding transcriptional ArsR family regulator